MASFTRSKVSTESTTANFTDAEFAKIWPKPLEERKTTPSSALVDIRSGDDPQNKTAIRVIIKLSDNLDCQYVIDSPAALSQWNDHAEISTRRLSVAHVAGRHEGAKPTLLWRRNGWMEKDCFGLNDYPIMSAEIPVLTEVSIAMLAFLAIGTPPNQVSSAQVTVLKAVRAQRLPLSQVRVATSFLLRFPHWKPDTAVRIFRKNPSALPHLWPMLTECLNYAATTVVAEGSLPGWLSEVMSVIYDSQHILVEATRRGYIAASEWKSLKTIVTVNQDTTAVIQAQEMLSAF